MNINKLDKMESLLKKCKVDLYKNFTEEAMYKNFTWQEGSKIHYELAVKFRDIFIDNDYSKINSLFDEDFGIHNGYELSEYLEVEFDEFKVKCDKFGLTKKADIFCAQVSDNLIYFSLGKKNDKALFEAIFFFNYETGKFKGNQYFFKTEPKMQFHLDKNNQYSYTRRINVKSPSEDIIVKAILPKRDGEDFIIGNCHLADFLGGHFYHTTYKAPLFKENTYWEILKFVTNVGTISYPVLMRGRDHPLFIDNLYPELKKNEVIFKEGIFPVILSVFFLNKEEEEFFKYPIINKYSFDYDVKFSCLTDTLSFDWIIERKL